MCRPGQPPGVALPIAPPLPLNPAPPQDISASRRASSGLHQAKPCRGAEIRAGSRRLLRSGSIERQFDHTSPGWAPVRRRRGKSEPAHAGCHSWVESNVSSITLPRLSGRPTLWASSLMVAIASPFLEFQLPLQRNRIAIIRAPFQDRLQRSQCVFDTPGVVKVKRIGVAVTRTVRV